MAETIQQDVTFVGFPKIARLYRDIIITEKIDGTNAQVFITDDGEMKIGKRTQYMTPQNDNHGFAQWCMDNKKELLTLGPGRHYGEWWGKGIQRNYGLQERRFSLFHTQGIFNLPRCCHVVPKLYEGIYNDKEIADALYKLRFFGSVAAPGFMKPEGIVIYHKAAGRCFKVTLENDDKPKLSKEE